MAERAFAQLEARIDKVAAELNVRIAEQGAALEKGFKEQARWTFLAWTTLLIPIIGLWMRR